MEPSCGVDGGRSASALTAGRRRWSQRPLTARGTWSNGVGRAAALARAGSNKGLLSKLAGRQLVLWLRYTHRHIGRWPFYCAMMAPGRKRSRWRSAPRCRPPPPSSSTDSVHPEFCVSRAMRAADVVVWSLCIPGCMPQLLPRRLAMRVKRVVKERRSNDAT